MAGGLGFMAIYGRGELGGERFAFGSLAGCAFAANEATFAVESPAKDQAPSGSEERPAP